MALYLDGQKIISGGSGSGGHTIVDDSGTALTQRTNLQFNGAYSEDNATDDTTEVNVVREMTKAEFDELTEEEKAGFINITDITGGNDDRFQPVIYSEEEREIGVWTDEKPLYQKTVYMSNVVRDTSWHNVAHNVSNIDTVVSVSGISLSGTEFYPITTIRTALLSDGIPSGITIGADTTNIRYINNWLDDAVFYVTIRYTKTTDQAGSGQWTPQGVPAVHYSEDEKVVGTWIDGSTLYEKTITNIPFPSSKGSLQTDTNIVANMTFIQTAFCSTFGVSNVVRPEGALIDQVGITAHIDSSTNHIILTTRSGCDRSTFSGIATLRYTKSST